MIKISTDKSKLDIHVIHQYLSEESYWAKGRTLELVKRSIDNSFCFGVFLKGKQIGFARVVTDFSVFGWIMDVFILKEHRGNGYSRNLIKTMLTHSDLKDIKRWGLGTNDAHGLYEKFGFTKLSNPQRMMEFKINKESNHR